MTRTLATAEASRIQRKSLRESIQRMAAEAKSPRLRTMREFAEQEIVVPSGQYQGMRFSTHRQPFSRLWFDAIDDQQNTADRYFSELVITGPSQSGKTLIGFVIPMLYHLFERRETVIAAVPDHEMVRDKWEQDIEPVLVRTRYRDFLPSSGSGSKGGRGESIRFKHGPMLRWMTAHGSDKSRAGFTARVVCMTETDGFDVRTSTSKEADKIEQIEARTRSFPASKRRIYKECTVTTSEGHTWRRYEAGTCSEIRIPCSHCGGYVKPEREHFHGWQDAATDAEAIRLSQFSCPACGEMWAEADRVAANKNCVIVHRGQTVDNAGRVVGEPPDTHTLGFRWSAANNLLVPAHDVGLDEWRAARSVDEDNEERKLSQFVWCVPYVPKDLDEVPLNPDILKDRTAGFGRGVIPANTKWVTIGVDVNKPFLHWVAVAWRSDNTGHVIDYNTLRVHCKSYEFGVAIDMALRELQGLIGTGWSETRYDRVHVDSRWMTSDVVRAIKNLKDKRWRPFMGLGLGHWSRGNHHQPRNYHQDVVWIGDSCYEKLDRAKKSLVTFADANHWKTWLHNRLAIDYDTEKHVATEGGITLFEGSSPSQHMNFARHMTAEKEVLSFEQGRGYVKTWEALRSQNHYLDATYMACVAGHRCGFMTAKPKQSKGAAGEAARSSYHGGHEDGKESPRINVAGRDQYF